MLGCIGADRGQAATEGAVPGITVAGKVAAGAFVAAGAVFADRPAVFIGNAGFEHHFLGQCLVIFLPGQGFGQVHTV